MNPPKSKLHQHAAATVKVVLPSGGFVGGLWLLQMAAQK